VVKVSPWIIAVVLVAIGSSAAADSAARRVALPGHGELELFVPTTWNVEVKSSGNELPPTLRFTAVGDRPFEFIVTPLWPIQGHVPPSDPETIREEVQHTAREAQSQAVESPIQVRELSGTSGKGYYFEATDRAPKPGEYKYMTQGILPVGELVVTFTVLTNDGQRSVIDAALEALRRAVHRSGGVA
jgi:hypothetical protein